MRAPNDEEIAGIAAAYSIVAARAAATPEAVAAVPPWRLAGRMSLDDAQLVRSVARSAARWSAAGRLDG